MMNQSVKAYGQRAVMLAIAGTLAGACLTSATRADIVSDWNEAAIALATQKRENPATNPFRLTAMHVAMFEAANAIERRYSSYRLNLGADRDTSKEAAIAGAAHAMLLTQYPDQKEKLDALLEESLNGGAEHAWNPVREGEPRSKGLALGRRAAAEVLAMRVNDGLDARESYRPATQPGVYVPTTIPVNSMLPGVTPWSMSSASQFRPAPPPALNSETWTKDVNEIREFGARHSKARSPEQTEIGRFWFFTGAATYSPIVRQIIETKKLNMVDSARLFAMATMANSDAMAAVFDAKYTYNFWRPITAIRNADQTGNAARGRVAAAWRNAHAPGISVCPLHCVRSREHGSTGGGRQRGRVLPHQPNGTRRRSQMDAALRLQ